MELRAPILSFDQHDMPEIRTDSGFSSIINDLDTRASAMGHVEAFRFFSDSAVRDDGARGATWDWAELRRRTGGVARELAASEAVGRGDRVLLTYSAGLEFIAALLGCFWIGAVPVPVSPPRPRERFSRLEHIARDAGVSAILSAELYHDKMSELAEREGLGPCLLSRAADPAQPCDQLAQLAPPPPLAFDDLAFLQYTSGSTSAPKGVMITHGMLATNLEQIRKGFGIVSSDRMACWLPHYHDMGLIGGILSAVHVGLSVVLMSPAAFLRDPIRYLEMVGTYKATIIGGPNFAFDHCVRHASPEALQRLDLSGLRFAFSGAEAIRARTLHRFQQTFAPCGFTLNKWAGCYGMAEATLCISVAPPAQGTTVLEIDADALTGGAIKAGKTAELAESGIPAEGFDLAIVDSESRQRLPDGRVGEIWVRSASIAKGYWGQPEASADVFDQQLESEGGWMRTGDLGALQDGRLFVTGRLKELIIIRGQNHYPQAIEASIGDAHPDILPGRVAAFPSDSSGDGGVGIACELSRHACRDPKPEPIFAAIQHALSEQHGLSADVIALIRPPALPLTPSGKIQRFACRSGLGPDGWLPVIAEWRSDAGQAEGSAKEATNVPAEPAGALARALRAAPPPLRRPKLLAYLRQAVTEATGGGVEVADDRRFFDIGLDSVKGVALIGRLEQALDLSLDATLIYEHTTLAALADHLLTRLSEPAAVSMPMQTSAAQQASRSTR